MRTNRIIEAARTARQQHWQDTSDVGIASKRAAKVTKAWQDSVVSVDVKREVPIGETLRERIDVVDLSTATAYELKVSANNPHHEFYKDIFKVLIYNRHHATKIKRLVFIAEKSTADRLNRGLGKAAAESMAQYDLGVAVDSI